MNNHWLRQAKGLIAFMGSLLDLSLAIIRIAFIKKLIDVNKLIWKLATLKM